MSVDVFLGLAALEHRRAVSRATQCHVHLTNKPFVAVGYHMPGDPGAPIGLLYGTERQNPRLMVVGEPRESKLRFTQLTAFALELNGYLTSFMGLPSLGGRTPTPSNAPAMTDAPQMIMPNPATAHWLCDVMGRRLRYLPTDGDVTVDRALPVTGTHLSFFAGQQVPGSSLVLPLTDTLASHWTTGQLAALDTSLASQLAWITDPEAMEDAETALPAGPVPDPDWEARELNAAIKAYHKLTEAGLGPADQPMRHTVLAALQPAWDACWQARDLLISLPRASRTRERWDRDAAQWSQHVDRFRAEQAYFRKRPKQLQVFQHLTRWERLTADLERDKALDDPLIMARYVAGGEALSGEVITVDATAKRPTVQVRAHLPFSRPLGTDLYQHLPPITTPKGTSRPILTFTVTDIDPDGVVSLDVTAGAVRRDCRHRLPKVHQQVVLGPFGPRDFRPNTLPTELPWTHAEEDDDA